MSDILAVWLLVVGLGDDGVLRRPLVTPMPDMQTCLQSVAGAKVLVATGGDAQAGVVVVCITGDPNDRSSCLKADKYNAGEPWPCTLKELAKP